MKTIKETRSILNDNDVDEKLLLELEADERKGVRDALAAYKRRQEKIQQIKLDFLNRKKYELPLWNQDKIIAGVDEVGRGPLAGPVVTAAVILPASNTLYEINDSKQLSEKKRRLYFDQICHQAIDIAIGIGSPELIDTENIYHATELTMKEAIDNLNVKPDHILVDAMTIPVDIKQTKIIKGDASSVSIAAASIVAKEIRDDLMGMYDRIYPGYDFSQNVGYGTKNHLLGLDKLGICPIHRKTFAPIKNML